MSGLTDTVNVSPEYVDDIVPSDTEITSTSGLSDASYNIIEMFSDTPFVNVTVSPVPKFIAPLPAFVVGVVPSGDAVAPLNVIVLSLV